MRKLFTGFSKFFAICFSLLFVITTTLALLLFNIGNQMFKADVYKQALKDLNAYNTLPALLGSALASSISYDPCAENPIICEDISSDLRACYENAFSEARYIALASGQDKPTEAEKLSIQSCLDQDNETISVDSENNIQAASLDVQDCVRQAVGEEPFNEFINNQRPPNSVEKQQIQNCFDVFKNENIASNDGMPSYFQNLSAAEWESIITTILPPNQMEIFIGSILDGVFSYLKGDVNQVTVSLSTLKNRLSGPTGDDLIMEIITSLPPCTEEELGLLNGTTGIDTDVLCKPPADNLSGIIPTLRQQLLDAVSQLPDEAVIIKPMTTDPSSGTGPLGNDPKAAFRLVELMLRLAPLLPMIFLLLVTLFGVRSLKGWMQWWGIPFFSAGMFAIGAGIAVQPIISGFWNSYVESRIPTFLTSAFTEFARDLIQYIAHNITKQVIVQAIVLVIIGLAIWIGSYFLKSKNGSENRQAQVAPKSPLPS
jgi:hypothetical protein